MLRLSFLHSIFSVCMSYIQRKIVLKHPKKGEKINRNNNTNKIQILPVLVISQSVQITLKMRLLKRCFSCIKLLRYFRRFYFRYPMHNFFRKNFQMHQKEKVANTN